MPKGDIKTKESKPKTIKALDKTLAWTERVKDPIVYANEKSKDVAEGNSSITDYGEDKIKYLSNRAKDESIYRSKQIKNKVVNNAKKKFQKNKLIKEKSKSAVKNTIKTEKKAVKTAKNTERVAKETAKVTKRMAEQGKKLAIEGTKKTVQIVKAVSKAIISGVKAIIAGVKSLVGMLAAGGVAAVIAIIIICLIGLLVGSIYGIFFSSDDVNKIKMSDCIQELNEEMDKKIDEIEKNTPHEAVIINSNKASWKDVLAIYTIKVSNGDNKTEVMSIDDNKKNILRQIFWDMNSISSAVIREVYNEDNSIDYLGTKKENIEKEVLHIDINSKSVEEMKKIYNFNNSQLKQLSELTNSKNESLWNGAIYGNYKGGGNAENWKQKGESWSNIKLGNSNKTIGDIGCLVTSISILIKKSGISTYDIKPFNPGTFVTALNNAYAFDNNGCLMYGPISKVIPNFQYAGRVDLSGKGKESKLSEIKRYYDSGYYLAIKVIDTDTSQHWVALDTIKNNNIIMSDPGSNSTDMWKEYNWNNTTQFVYFKASK